MNPNNDSQGCALVAGGSLVLLALVVLSGTFVVASFFGRTGNHELDERLQTFAYEMSTVEPLPVLWAIGTVLMFGGVFLCVKARLAPPLFWTDTGRHLLFTAGIAGVLCFLPFAVVVLAPR